MRHTQAALPTAARLAVVPVLALAAACGDATSGPAESKPTPFGTPTRLEATATSANGVRVAWTPVSGATAYLVERAPAATASAFARVATPSAPPFDDAGLLPGTAYQYRVAAVRGTDTTAFAAPVTVTTRAVGASAATLRGDIAASRTLTADTTYVISGAVKVRSGATLTIGPGTRLVGDSTVAGSSLWIVRGARIVANGTAELPIVFTSQRPAGSRAAGDWGGLVIIGAAPTSRTGPSAATFGPLTGSGSAESYGGTNAGDDSGVLRYVRIEFAGAAVPSGINGDLVQMAALNLYGVGRGTRIEYVQSLASLGSGFQWVGGTVDGRYLVSYDAGDDHFAWRDGYAGRNQFVIGYEGAMPYGRAGSGFPSSDPRGFQGYGCDLRIDGCTSYTATPLSAPVFANFTLVGPGATAPQFATPDNVSGIVVRRGSAGTFVNGVVARWPGFGLSIRESATDTLRQRDSLFVGGVLLADNARGNFEPEGGAGFALARYFPQAAELTSLGAAALLPGIPAPGAAPSAALDFTPSAAQARTGGLASFPARVAARTTGFFGAALATTAYAGAADPAGSRWWQGWTSYERSVGAPVVAARVGSTTIADDR